MDEKSRSVDDGFDEAYLPQTPSFKNARRRGLPAYFKDLTMRRLCYAMCVTLTVWLLLHTVNASYRKCRLPGARTELSNAEVILAEENVIKVALEAHIMSKCPDAKACLQMLVVPAMEQISDKVDFRLSYIGRSVQLPALHPTKPSTFFERTKLTPNLASTRTLTPYPACMVPPNASGTSFSSALPTSTQSQNSTSASPTA